MTPVLEAHFDNTEFPDLKLVILAVLPSSTHPFAVLDAAHKLFIHAVYCTDLAYAVD